VIEYSDDLGRLSPADLDGFFQGWAAPPTPGQHLKLLKDSYAFLVAIDIREERVVGFVSAVSDGVLSAYIPLLEVRPEYRGQGIGRELMSRMLEKLKGLYMIDLSCDEHLVDFYERLGFQPARAMLLRDYRWREGK